LSLSSEIFFAGREPACGKSKTFSSSLRLCVFA